MKTCFSKLWGGVIKAIFSHRLHSAWPPTTRGVEIERKRIMDASIGDITSQSHIPSLRSPCENDWTSPSSWKSWGASWYFARKRNENSFSSVLFSVTGLKIFGDILSIRPFVLPTMKPQSRFITLFIMNTSLRNIDACVGSLSRVCKSGREAILSQQVYFFFALPPVSMCLYVLTEKEPEQFSCLACCSSNVTKQKHDSGYGEWIGLQRNVRVPFIDKLTNTLVCLERKGWCETWVVEIWSPK